MIAQQPTRLKNRGTNYCYELVADVTLPERKESMYLGSQTPYLDGKGHTVTYHMKGVLKNDDGEYGLFGNFSGECSNLALAGTVDVTLTGPVDNSPAYFGGLAGEGTGTFSNCRSELDLTVRYDKSRSAKGNLALGVGGLIGDIEEGNITDCIAAGRVKAITANQSMDVKVGGLVGVTSHLGYKYSQTKPGLVDAPPAEERKSVIRNCGSNAVILAEGGEHSFCGGILGLQTYDTYKWAAVDDPAAYALVESCWSTATLSASGASFQSDCGGIVGQNNAGTIRNCWAKPTISISGTYIFKNQGGICGAAYNYYGKSIASIEDCWAEVSNCRSLLGDGHYGGIVARVSDCTVSNCFVLGTEGYAPQNAITYASWTTGAVSGCANLTGGDRAQREEFYNACGWDFETVWDRSGAVPILRGCDAQAQRAVQIITGQQVIV